MPGDANQFRFSNIVDDLHKRNSDGMNAELVPNESLRVFREGVWAFCQQIYPVVASGRRPPDTIGAYLASPRTIRAMKFAIRFVESRKEGAYDARDRVVKMGYFNS